jgi:hypothetical protein
MNKKDIACFLLILGLLGFAVMPPPSVSMTGMVPALAPSDDRALEGCTPVIRRLGETQPNLEMQIDFSVADVAKIYLGVPAVTDIVSIPSESNLFTEISSSSNSRAFTLTVDTSTAVTRVYLEESGIAGEVNLRVISVGIANSGSDARLVDLPRAVGLVIVHHEVMTLVVMNQ